MSSFTVGIDLGTTNCAVAYTESGRETITSFLVPQLVGAGEVSEQPTLPSFLLLPGESDVAKAGLALPWRPDNSFATGVFARERGAEIPHRVVASAKSWLSHPGIDRESPVLPWRDEDSPGGEQVSPVEASTRYLQHIRDAWNHTMPAKLEDQQILLTVPASFDAQARELTVKAANAAGLRNLVLLEEPQAAFYSWLQHSGANWREQLSSGDIALVCDIGGGTSDFSLISVSDDGAGNLALDRIAVGDHILLGGDNMDIALAYCVEAKLGKKISSSQKRSLTHTCRRAKENLLSDPTLTSVPVSILGSGSKLIGGTLRSEVTQEDIKKIVLAGFLPETPITDKPKRPKTVVLQQIGLPYAYDAAISRHLASFLAEHQVKPNVVLFNGGVTKGVVFQERITALLDSWLGHKTRVLSGTNADLAVAHGAAYYGLVRSGKGIRIRGGTARSYYIGVESSAPAIPGFEPPLKALCVAPFGMEEGATENVPGPELGFLVGEPTTFRFFASSTRKLDRVGSIVDVDDESMTELTQVETNLEARGDNSQGHVVPVSLTSTVTEVGTLELWGTSRKSSEKWRLEYSVRDD